MVRMKWTLVLALPLVACVGTPRGPESTPVSRVSRLDSASVRRLCAKPDSVLAGHAACELRDQHEPIRVF